MAKLGRAPKKKKRKMNPIFGITLTVALLLAASWSYQLFQLNQNTEAYRSELQQEKAELTNQNKALRQEIDRLNTPAHIEQLARERLGLVRKGEILIAPKESEKDT